MRKRNRCTALFMALGLAVLSGCGAASSGGSIRTETAAAATAETAASYDAAMPEEAAVEAAAGVADSAPLSHPDVSGRKLIRDVHLSMETDDFDSLMDRLSQQIAGAGGYVESSSISGRSLRQRSSESGRYASMTARIPADRLDSFLDTMETQSNVTYRSEQTTDVTLTYSDLESRKKSLTIEQERIWELLEKADTLESVIALEERLSEIRYQLESMESQLRLYDNQVDYSTVYLDIQEVAVFTPAEEESPGQQIQREFSENLRTLGVLLTNAVIFLAAASPFWVPALLVLLLLVLLLRKRKRKPKAEPPAPNPPAKEKESPDSGQAS